MKGIGIAVILLGVVFATGGQVTAVHQPDSVWGHNDWEDRRNIVSRNHFVPHTSTVPANAGEQIDLFVRERVRHGRRHYPRGVVLMIHGATTSSVPDFDLRFQDYDWMAFLARAGFDVFTMDQQGYGWSARPQMDDACNTTSAEQKSYLIPNPLQGTCPSSYPFALTSIESDWDEIDTVVDYLRQLRQVDRVNIVAWSRGGPRAGGYVARHADKVERLVLYAPGYKRLAPNNPSNAQPESGVPMTVLSRAAFHTNWDTQVGCVDQFDPEIRPVITSTMLTFDPLGSTWGSDGVRRAPVWSTPGNGFPYWGWNASLAALVQVPTLFIRGDLDTQVPGSDVRDLFADIGTDHKVFVHVACASHYLVWERQHMVLLRASLEWLRHGTFHGEETGSFAVDTDEQVYPE